MEKRAENRDLSTEIAEAMELDLGSLDMIRKAKVYKKRLRLQRDKMRRAVRRGILSQATADRWIKLCRTSVEADNLALCEGLN